MLGEVMCWSWIYSTESGKQSKIKFPPKSVSVFFCWYHIQPHIFFCFCFLLHCFLHFPHLFCFHPTNMFFLTSTQTESLLLAIMFIHHYMLITTSRNYTCDDALAYLGCPPYPLFEASRLKCDPPTLWHFCMGIGPTYFFSEILLGSQCLTAWCIIVL